MHIIVRYGVYHFVSWGNMKNQKENQFINKEYIKKMSFLSKHFGLFFFASSFLLSCGDVNITKTPSVLQELSSNSVFCTIPPLEIGRYTKIMFVVDQSGSNVIGNNSEPTDPDKSRRLGALTKFWQANGSNPYIQWGFISFQQDKATYFIENGYFQNSSAFESALGRFQATPDINATPYKAALTRTREAIESDIALSDDNTSNYEIIFLSDGVPTDYGQTLNDIDDAALRRDVELLMKLAPGRLRLSTVYYSTPSGVDLSALERLQEMAKLGNGKFQDASKGEDINIDELIVGGRSLEPYQIKDFFVYNLNSTLCDNGEMGVDSDADGLCDQDEDRYNIIYQAKIDGDINYTHKRFDKYSRNSFSPAFSDMFILKNLQGEALPTCSVTESKLDTDMDLLNECEEKFLANSQPQGPTQVWTTEMLTKEKHTSRTNFDSDGDGIMDSLEFFFFKEKGAALNYNSIDRSVFGRTYYDLFKNHQSKVRPESSKPYNIDVRQVEKNDQGQNCYTFSQESLELYKTPKVTYSQTGNLDLVHGVNENVVLVYYIMVPENDPESKGVMRFSYQKIKVGQTAKQLNLSEDRFDNVKAK